ncbi:MAG: hypothetical protein R3B96_15170 [Pirellulaceae bacterium]
MDYFQSLQASLVFPEFRVSPHLPLFDRGPNRSDGVLSRRSTERGSSKTCHVFDRFPDLLFLLGHFHRWEAEIPGSIGVGWSEVLRFDENERYIVVIDAVMAGNCGAGHRGPTTRTHPVSLSHATRAASGLITAVTTSNAAVRI